MTETKEASELSGDPNPPAPRSNPLSALARPSLGRLSGLFLGLLLLGSCGDAPQQTTAEDAGLADLLLDLPATSPDLQVDAPPPPGPIVDLRGDANRDGVVDLQDPTDDDGEETWDATHGAIFLANIDDDGGRCPKPSLRISDDALAACHDAADEQINGAEDLADLARLKVAPWPEAPEDATGTLTLSLPGAAAEALPETYVRLFKGADQSATPLAQGAELTANELRAGVNLLLEGRDVLRDDTVWDGYALLTFEVRFSEEGEEQVLQDQVMLRLAPLMTSHHLQPVEQVYATSLFDRDAAQFRTALGQAMQAAGIGTELLTLGEEDQWTQDLFETAWMSMPAAGGEQQVIRVYLRSANIEDPHDSLAPLRYAGRDLYNLRGPDVAVVQQYQLHHSMDMESLNSLGNLETVPPYTLADGTSYPLGRMIMGSVPDFHPDPSFTRLLESQRLQPPIWVDTSWLLVGHVDETISFIKAQTPRGWLLLLNDPELARQMLEQAAADGHGDAVLFEGKYWLSDWNSPYSAMVTVDDLLDDTEVMAESAKAAVEVQAQLETLQQELGITEEEIVRIPYLHYPVYGYSVAYQPGTINGTVLADGHFAAPDPHGPLIVGEDIFKKQLIEALAPHGITVHFIENWNLYHRLMGEVHCGSNVSRARPSAINWWESGR